MHAGRHYLRKAYAWLLGRGIPLRLAVLRAMLLITATGVLLISAFHQARESGAAKEALAGEVRERAGMVSRRLDDYLSAHRTAVEMLASCLAHDGEANDQRWLNDELEAFHQRYPAFLTLLVANSAGEMTAAYPPQPRERLRAMGSVGDRSYFTEAIRTHKAFISPAFQGRGFGRAPVVAVSAPVMRGGVADGIVEASLDLDAFRLLHHGDAGFEHLQLLIMDGDGSIVYATERLGLAPLADARALRMVQAADDTPSRFRDDGEDWLIARSVASRWGWRVVVRHSLAGLERNLSEQRRVAILALLLVLGLSIPVARIVGRRFTRPLEQLAASVEKFEPRLGEAELPEVGDAPVEVRQLAARWSDLSRRLGESYQSLEAERARAEDANRAKSRFLCNIGHELRTPLNGVLGAVQLLDSRGEGADQQEHVAIIRNAGETLLGLIDDLLDVAQMETGRPGLSEGPARLRELLGEVSARHFEVAAAKGVSATSVTGASVPATVIVDGRRLRRVLDHLLSNAVKFTSAGHISVAVFSLCGQTVEFRVADTGQGIPRELQARVFEPFFQADPSDARSFGGAGLGLTLASQLVKLMGGEIGFESEPGRGSQFWFRLPLRPAEPDGASVSLVEPACAAAGRPHVLVAEDNPVNQRIARTLLEKLGYAVDVASNGVEAVAAVQQAAFDLILMDCQMPVMDGYQAAQRIRQSLGDAAPPIVALTANSRPEDRARCLAAGMSDHLAKPIGLAALAAAVEQWVSVKAAR